MICSFSYFFLCAGNSGRVHIQIQVPPQDYFIYFIFFKKPCLFTLGDKFPEAPLGVTLLTRQLSEFAWPAHIIPGPHPMGVPASQSMHVRSTTVGTSTHLGRSTTASVGGEVVHSSARFVFLFLFDFHLAHRNSLSRSASFN